MTVENLGEKNISFRENFARKNSLASWREGLLFLFERLRIDACSLGISRLVLTKEDSIGDIYLHLFCQYSLLNLKQLYDHDTLYVFFCVCNVYYNLDLLQVLENNFFLHILLPLKLFFKRLSFGKSSQCYKSQINTTNFRW